MDASPSPSPNAWEDMLRKMLPEGAPLPDEDQLDYSISVDYTGPSPFFKPPINPIVPKTRFTAFPKQPPSLTPTNSSWLSSTSTSDTTNSNNKRLSASFISFNDVTDVNYGLKLEPATVSDRFDPDHDNLSPELETKGGDCALSSRARVRRCVRCGKGGNGVLRGREGCIVCGAEYCKKCVLKAMGSMPEGRKCVGCIGKPIDEANRGKLGKGSRLLSSLCSRLEVRRTMQVERECRVNQVRPEQVILNGRELGKEELDELLGCAVPPRDLKPGRYWYDKDSGLWGKEGEKPFMTISSRLDVGGKLQIGASKGDTRVYMNGREITKLELRVLKLAKVQCPRETRFWLYEDGSYEEEGQNKIKGNIWEKASIRFICSLFSLAVPPHRAKKECGSSSSRLFPENLEQQHRVQKLLLIGLEGSGASTIFKQAKLIYTNKFTPEEKLKALEISSKEYDEPSENDILFAEGITPSNGLASIDFSFDDQTAVSQICNQQPLSTMYQLILLSSPRLNNGCCKWLDMFEGMDAVILCVKLNDYNQQLWTHTRGFQQNKMVASRDFFEGVARKSCFDNTSFLLLLTNYDVFEEQINKAPLTVCEWFSDFKPSKNHGLAPQAFHYIAAKFKDLYASITGRKLYVHQLINYERKSVDRVYRYIREILDWDEHKDDGFFAVSDQDTVSDAES